MPALAEHPVVRNVPNALTLLRLLAVPVFIALVVREGGTSVLAGIVFMAASFTDFFDGFLARRMGVMSQFGKVADPIADRLLVNSAAVLLSIYDPRMQGWEFLVVLWRDVLATWGFARLRQHVMLPDVNRTGKLGMALMMGGMAWLLVLPQAGWPLWPFYAGLALSIIALVRYVRRYRRLLADGAQGGVGGRAGGGGGTSDAGDPATLRSSAAPGQAVERDRAARRSGDPA